MVSKQVEWAVKMFWRYINEEKPATPYLRGLHYFIVSLPREERQMPAKGGGTRTYENTKNDYKNLSRLIVEARIAGLIPFDMLEDLKNEEVYVTVKERTPPKLKDILVDSGGYFSIHTDPMKDFEEFLEGIVADVAKPKFYSQKYRITLAIEKSKAKDRLKRLAMKYGADFIHFGGQFSVTRVHDIARLAKEENKPCLILYISDLDCAGWFMPEAFFRRLMQIYPNPENKIVRVALTKEQADKYNLPPSFEPDMKKYPPGQIKRFIEESGSDVCIEVDAIPEGELVKIAEEELRKWAMLDEDEKLYRETIERINRRLEELKKEIASQYSSEYENIKEKFNRVIREMEETYRSKEEEIRKAIDEMREIESKIKEFLKKELGEVVL